MLFNLSLLTNHKYIVAFAASIILDNVCCFILHFTFNDYNLANTRTQAADIWLGGLVRTLVAPALIWCGATFGKKEFHSRRERKKREYELVFSVAKESKPEEQLAEKKAEKWRRGFLASIYGCYTFFQIYLGIKCVILNFSTGSRLFVQEFSMVSLVVILNLELYFGREIITEFTRAVAYFHPNLHVHPLYSRQGVEGSCWCDACDTPVYGAVYTCSGCDFDVCEKCVSNDEIKLEGLMRCDKGLVQAEAFTNVAYAKKILFFISRHKLVVFFALVCLLLSSLASILLPNFQGAILDQVIKLDMQGFHKYIILYIVANALVGLFSSLQTFCFHYVGKHMLYDVQVALFSNVLRQDIAFFDGMSAGMISSRLSYDTEAMISPANEVLAVLLSAFTLILGGLIMCIYTSWRLSVLAFTTVGPITLIYREYAQVARTLSTLTWNAFAKASNIVDESLHNIRMVRAFTQENAQEGKYVDARSVALKHEVKSAIYEAGTTLINCYMEQIITVLVLWYGGLLAMQNSEVLSIGSLITFQLYWNLINSNFETLTRTAASFTKAGGAAGYILQQLACKPSIDPYIGKPCPTIGDIELKDMYYYYQMKPSQIVLKSINLKITQGHVVAFVGKSGCGKSTIINLLLRYYDPKGGSILLNGVDLREYNPTSFREHVGVVAQDTELMNDTVLSNITLAKGLGKYSMEEVIEAAKKANAHDFIMENEDGYSMRVGQNGDRLSGGQRQRVALARAFLKRPSLLFLDEATSALDAESESLVQEAIDKLIAERKCTVILVAHRLSTVAGANLIAVVDGGSIAESGTHDELMKKGGMYAKMVEKQTRKYRNLIEED